MKYKQEVILSNKVDIDEMNGRLNLKHKKSKVLLDNIKDNLGDLKKLLESMSGTYYEDTIYRFYHGSFKVYYLQDLTIEAYNLFIKISPHVEVGDSYKYNPFCQYFEEIYREGTGWEHKLHHNSKWTMVTRPIVEAFFHTKYFVEMAVKCGSEMDESPMLLPSGWASF